MERGEVSLATSAAVCIASVIVNGMASAGWE